MDAVQEKAENITTCCYPQTPAQAKEYTPAEIVKSKWMRGQATFFIAVGLMLSIIASAAGAYDYDTVANVYWGRVVYSGKAEVAYFGTNIIAVRNDAPKVGYNYNKVEKTVKYDDEGLSGTSQFSDDIETIFEVQIVCVIFHIFGWIFTVMRMSEYWNSSGMHYFLTFWMTLTAVLAIVTVAKFTKDIWDTVDDSSEFTGETETGPAFGLMVAVVVFDFTAAFTHLVSKHNPAAYAYSGVPILGCMRPAAAPTASNTPV
jgi:hypothetical protein